MERFTERKVGDAS